jgi:hypothetical protein
VGLTTPLLYRHPGWFCFDIVEPRAPRPNAAGWGWDPPTGWGSPRGTDFLGVLGQARAVTGEGNSSD